ncbi:hypothetical protein HPP92_003038 [Vanilla planifolia]|uniref:LisH domain-containing protein n=1 Tax=Vanilla planifolia TaxID=51239 RepID=A0A835SAZ7_VANPL|nr:hypothetical protein HPP92_003038 [Vanilla planifolia]
MAKQGRAKKQDKLGTGKVTPMQIAFIVDRYLTQNNYSVTLASFRSEASDLLSRTQGKEVPKGLMGLADILDDYIRLKEQRLAMDHEKQRLEAAMKGIQEVIRVYHSDKVSANGSGPLSVSPQQIKPSPPIPFFPISNPMTGSHSIVPVDGTCNLNLAKPTVLQAKAADATASNSMLHQHINEKRKASKSNVTEPPQKQLRTRSTTVSNKQGIGLTSQDTCTTNGDFSLANHPVVLQRFHNDSTLCPSVLDSSVLNNKQANPDGSQPSTSSPKPPPQELNSQIEMSASPLENSVSNAVNASSFQKHASTSCSVISETIIISPLKHKGYYAIERSYQMTCSPLKTSPKKLGKRDHVKGRLDFDNTDEFDRLEKHSAADNSLSSPTDGETSSGFDFDLPDFEFFDGDFISGLLGDMAGQNDELTGPDQAVDGGCQVTDKALLDSSIAVDASTSTGTTGLQGIFDGMNSAKKTKKGSSPEKG